MLGFLRRLFRSRTHYVGNGYSLKIEQLFREGVDVVYVRASDRYVLGGERYGKHWGSIAVGVSKDFPEDLIPQLVSDLSEGLSALGYGYTISKAGVPQPVPQEEQQKAIEALRAIGMEPTISGNRVALAKLPNFSVAGRSKEDVIAQGIRIGELVRTVSGWRTPITVLAHKEKS